MGILEQFKNKWHIIGMGTVFILLTIVLSLLVYSRYLVSNESERLSSPGDEIQYVFVPLLSLPEEMTHYTVRDGKVYADSASGEIVHYPDASDLEVSVARQGDSILHLTGYERDSERVLGMPEADRDTFQVKDGGYALDKNHVYSNRLIISGFNPDRFRFIGVLRHEESFATDGSQVYISACGIPGGCWTGIVAGADPKTFVLLPEALSNVGLTRDKDHIYCNTNQLQHLDPEDLSSSTSEMVDEAIRAELAEHGYIGESCAFVDELFRK
ncbi:MAG TPA: DKNYY domain-containing protein [Candidatus Paceibacterota bacterium]